MSNACRDRRLGKRLAVAAGCAAWLVAAPSEAGVVVVSNRTTNPVVVTAVLDGGLPQQLALPPGDCRPMFAKSQALVRLPGEGVDNEYDLSPDCAYYIGANPGDDKLSLGAIGLGETPGRRWPEANGAEPLPVAPLTPGIGVERGVITVKLLVDDDELRVRQVWEPALRRRLDEASDIMAAHGGVRLQVIAVDTWESDDRQTDFERSLAEFEKEVLPAPAQVAIGFSSQYMIAEGRVHMGGTRGALHSHILLKERARNVMDTERMEFLVHELGHFQGASHSPEPESVMHPVVGSGRQRRRGVRIQFDPVNTLLVSLLGEEIRQRGVRKLDDLSPGAKRRMGEIYAALRDALPDDPSTGNYLRRIAAAATGPLVEDAQRVLQQVVTLARAQKQLRDRAALGSVGAAGPAPLEGDELLEHYVRQAAVAAQQARPENARLAFVLGLGIALDDTGTLRNLPLTSVLATHLEDEQQFAERLSTLGTPTMLGRNDLTKHFFVSAHLVALLGSQPARGAGMAKELLDADGGSGFSFRDMAANRAGIVFAHAVLSGKVPLDAVAERFTVAAYMPAVEDLRESMQAEEFFRDFGGVADERLTAELARIEQRIAELPVYQNAAASPAGK